MKFLMRLLLAVFLYFNIYSLNVSVLGIGRLGLCTALCLEKSGHNVIGMDVNRAYVDCVSSRQINSPEPKVDEYLKNAQNFIATTSLDDALNFSDIYFVVVPTPTGAYEAYDHNILSSLLIEINKRKVENKHIVICCTVFPGYIKNIAYSLIKDCKNMTISYNPEFIAQGNIISGFENPDMILIGEGSKQIGDLLESIYKQMCKNQPRVCRMSPSSAEITKLAVNCFITTKIAFANSIGDVADLTKDANKYDILKAVGADSRVGNKCLNPGYGFGGPCFPRDNRALGSYIKKVGLDPLLQVTTDELNKKHAEFMANSLIKRGDVCIFEDVNYKENCNVIIIEESQKLAVAELLAKNGKKVVIKDRESVNNEVRKKYGNLFDYIDI